MIDGAIIATQRFGFAARAGDLAAAARDPRGFVLEQLVRKPAPLPAELPGSADMVARILERRRAQAEARQGNAAPVPETGRMGVAKEQGRAQPEARAPEPKGEFRGVYLAEIGARYRAAIRSPAPLQERLVHFWSNHFTVSAQRPIVTPLVGAFEREAIRPHVTGRFLDMLRAVVRHPAMGFYLDNVASVGPNSPFGRRREKGLNENLGRELLELHTLGVDGGYGQADVEALARILTGWTIARLKDPHPGSFRFEPRIHEPGDKTLLGKVYREAGEEEGERALADLARHPATARHVAMRLARHFIADKPPAAAVERIARAFRGSDGDLMATTRALVASDEVWSAPFQKLRTPSELVIAVCRATGLDAPPDEALAGSLRTLDQPAFVAPSPKGWPDEAAAWAGPEAILRRAEWCETFAARLPDPPDPLAVAEASFGERAPAETLEALRRAPSRRIALALLLASPEFQRR